MNRIGIIYIKKCDRNERLDFLFLKNIRDFYDRLIVICDSFLEYEGRRLLEQFTKEIIVEDLASGIAAWEFCYMSYLSEEERNSCDELTLISLNFFGLIKDYENFVSSIDSMEADVINICPYDLKGDGLSDYVGYDYLIFKRRVLEDYTFAKFWQEPDINNILGVFTDSGFRCTNYSGGDDLFILSKTGIKGLNIEADDYELKKNIKALVESADVFDGTRESLIRNIVTNNSTESMRNLFDLDFVLESGSEAAVSNGFTLCMFVETEEGLEKANTIIENADKSWNIHVWLREEDFLEQISREPNVINTDLFYRECMWEKIVETVEYVQDSLIGFVFENGDIENWQDNYENLFGDQSMIAQLQQLFEENEYMAAVLPRKFIGSDRFIRNELYRLQLQKILEFQEISWDIETPECAICCRTEKLRECIENVRSESDEENEGEKYESWCEAESVKIIPHLLQINGYMVGHAICNRNVLEYSRRLYTINEKQIRNCMESGRLAVTDFGEYLKETGRLLEGYYSLYNRVERLMKE